MANTLLASQPAGAFNAAIPDLTFTTVDATNGNSFVNTGRTVLIVNNASMSPITITFTVPSSPRTLNGAVGSTQVKTIAATTIGFFGPFDPGAFTNTSGLVNFVSSSASTVTAAVVEQFLSPTP